MREQVRKLALELGVVGLMNVQFAVKDNGSTSSGEPPCRPYRAVRLKATGAPLARSPPASWPVRA